jgi:hypothetical protein
MKLRLALLALVLVAAAGCGSEDSTCSQVSAHLCQDPGCCDPACKSAYAVWQGGTLLPCDTIGYECGLFEAKCVCGSDHSWICESMLPRDLSTSIPADFGNAPID